MQMMRAWKCGNIWLVVYKYSKNSYSSLSCLKREKLRKTFVIFFLCLLVRLFFSSTSGSPFLFPPFSSLVFYFLLFYYFLVSLSLSLVFLGFHLQHHRIYGVLFSFLAHAPPLFLHWSPPFQPTPSTSMHAFHAPLWLACAAHRTVNLPGRSTTHSV